MDKRSFTSASKAWMKNKIRRGEMIYYKCEATLKNGHDCTRIASQNEKYWFLDKHYCTQHAQLAARKQTM
jgi:hypothetical protein